MMNEQQRADSEWVLQVSQASVRTGQFEASCMLMGRDERPVSLPRVDEPIQRGRGRRHAMTGSGRGS